MGSAQTEWECCGMSLLIPVPADCLLGPWRGPLSLHIEFLARLTKPSVLPPKWRLPPISRSLISRNSSSRSSTYREELLRLTFKSYSAHSNASMELLRGTSLLKGLSRKRRNSINRRPLSYQNNLPECLRQRGSFSFYWRDFGARGSNCKVLHASSSWALQSLGGWLLCRQALRLWGATSLVDDRGTISSTPKNWCQ